MCLTSALPKILTEVETFGERCMGAVQCVRSNATLMQLVDQVHKVQVQHQIGDAPDK